MLHWHGDNRKGRSAFCSENTARLLDEISREPNRNTAHIGSCSRHHCKTARELTEVGQRGGVHGSQMIAHTAALAKHDTRVPWRQVRHNGTERAGIWDHSTE